MALRISSEATDGSAISPLRTPRERAWPTPMILSTPAALISPTTAQIFEVPISSPTIMGGGSNIFLFVTRRLGDFLRFRRKKARFQPARRQIVGDRKINRGQVLAGSLAVIMDQTPAAELVIEIVQAKNHVAILAGGDLQYARRGQIDLLDIHQAGHGRMFQRCNQSQGGLHLRRLGRATRAQIGQRNSDQEREMF